MSLVFEAVSKSFGGEPVLRELDLTVGTGQLMTVLGPSGGGKTTMLRIAAGLESPTSGVVHLDGKPVRLGDSSVAFQDTPLYPHLSVLDNVLFPLRLKAARGKNSRYRTDRERRAAASDALEMMHIPDLGPRRINQLSGGQRQRVGIARALVRDVGLYLFDEPLAHLDQALARDIREDLRAVQREKGLTMVYVTHQVEEAFALGDTVTILNDGRLEQIGPPQELWQRPATQFVAGFLGGHSMNFVPGEDGIVRGFRPENCLLQDFAGVRTDRGNESVLRFNGTVVGSSFLGEQTLVVVDAGSGMRPLRALLPSVRFGEPVDPPAIGEKACVLVDGVNVHEFDAATGQRVLAADSRGGAIAKPQ